jgi:hypothetical protein
MEGSKREEQTRRGYALTGTVTSFSEALLTTMFTVYSMLKSSTTTVSFNVKFGIGDTELFVVSSFSPGEALGLPIPTRWSMMHVPTVPQSACSAVKVYGNGKWISTYLLYSVNERLRVKYSTIQNAGLGLLIFCPDCADFEGVCRFGRCSLPVE